MPWQLIKDYATPCAQLRNLTRNKKIKMEQWRKRSIWKTKVRDNQSWNDGIFWSKQANYIKDRSELSWRIEYCIIPKRTTRTVTDTLYQQDTIGHGKKIQPNRKKDALAVKWTVTRLRNYLIGASKFTITSHKLLILMFNKFKPRLPPRVEKWIREITDWFWTWI